jgi:phospholipase/carboxylesterase
MSNLSTELLPVVELKSGTLPTHTIIWMHGLGADGNDFVPIVNELRLPQDIQVRFVFPHAPERPVTINNGYVMRAWYDISNTNYQDELGIRDSQQAINALIDQEIQSGIASENIILAGFSQGGAMALQVGLRQPKPLGGIIALSCYLPLADTLAGEAESVNASIPVFMAHGSHDSVIPISQAVTSKETLLAANYSVEWHEYPMAHSVCMEEIEDISHWLGTLLSNRC